MTIQTVACIDGSGLTQSVCDYAAWAAQRLGNQLVLLNVLDDVRTPTDVDFSGSIGVDTRQSLLLELAEIEEKRAKLARRQGLMVLDAAQRHLANQQAAPIETRQRHGDLVDSLLEIQADTRLYVIGKQGRHGPGIGQHIGHQVERVIRAVERPVWVIPQSFTPPKTIMLAFDGSATARKAVDMVAGSPLFAGMPVHVVMVGAENHDNLAELEWARTQLQHQQFVVTMALEQGDVETTLLEYADNENCDVIVMGAYGHSRIREFFVGSHTNRLLLSSHKPLLLLR
ncbi:universal stress protein [Aliidiomarina maris]|uniref:Nucleotide-binding universal stress UspA family protein n=1 Tax=Aliidiomarina maris TaxID=531312 RepID=A0A327WYW9_9GAMM|nr:universal stress protein [Aliidiomarina maris]MBA3987843.1 universal stress protein UspA [Idiomarina sp.]MCL5050740.1 universal stress protein [Bacillota bacterium]RAJ97058.1 nucleotide-binding universal stress UspA family protein [Aliidiomarina maris]RUO24662.1 universal stress protein UspA [Aliidiomarina maris]